MQWIAPSEKDAATDTLEKRLWAAADQLRANRDLNSAQYSTPVAVLFLLSSVGVRYAKFGSDWKRSRHHPYVLLARTNQPATMPKKCAILRLTPTLTRFLIRHPKLLACPSKLHCQTLSPQRAVVPRFAVRSISFG